MTRVSVITCVRQAGDDRDLEKTVLACCPKALMFPVVGAKSIGEGYNTGVESSDSLRDPELFDSRAREHEILIFSHCDVELWCSQRLWNEMLLECVKPDVGFVGVAGTDCLEKHGCWWLAGNAGPSTHLHGDVAHTHEGKTYTSCFGPYGRTVVMDGVFLAIARSKLDKIGCWNQKLDWHFYDLDMTLRAHLAGFKNMVVPLPLLHKSIGIPGGSWEQMRQKFLKTYGDKLPVAL